MEEWRLTSPADISLTVWKEEGGGDDDVHRSCATFQAGICVDLHANMFVRFSLPKYAAFSSC